MVVERATDEVVAQFLREKLETIKQEYSPRRFIIFGSRATGRARIESDIDVIVVSERFRGTRFVNRMGEFLVKVRPHVHVDALCYTPEEFEDMLAGESSFIRNAVDEGIRVI
jgi:predicted nucleotidyltransferase